MPLVTATNMLLKAQKDGYAIAAFNVENMEMAQAVIAAAEAMESPVMVQTTPSTLRYGGVKLYRQMIGALAEEAKIPVAIHLDHGENFALAMQAIRAGYTSVMIDGSHKTFEENIALTKSVADVCKAIELPAEAELGKVGGKEDDLESDGPGYTEPEEAVEFVRQTGVFSLAIGIGTSHGPYAGVPHLDMERISIIAGKIDNPLVLHGTSGLPDEDVQECIRRGMCKVNYATELRIEFSNGVKAALAQKPDAFDPKFYLKAGRDMVLAIAKKRIEICGSQGRA